MSKSKWVPYLVLILLISAGLNVYFLLGNRSGHSASDVANGKELYICPMHPEVTQDHPADCPLCGMDLVPVKDGNAAQGGAGAHSEHKSSGVKKAAKYHCPMHPTIVQDHPGDCPLCGMKLLPLEDSEDTRSTTSAGGPRKITFYRSPMDPTITSPVPRKDEMGMDYVPVYEDDAMGGASTVQGRAAVTIDPARQQLIGLRTAAVTRSEVSGGWRTVGRVQEDPTRVSKINVKVAGYVEHVFVDFVGRPVKRGEPLFTLYSPELFAAQREFLIALGTRDTITPGRGDDFGLVTAARQKLELWDVTDEQIQRLEQTGEPSRTLTFVSPVTGVVTAKNVVEGTALGIGETAYEVTDLSTVWILADAYQSDVARATVGVFADVSFASLLNRAFAGKVTFVDPVLDPQTLTFKVRVEIENRNGDLKPGMFAEVQFRGVSQQTLTIPYDAIIPSGRGSYVFVALGEGRFEPRAVILGQKSDDHVEVLEGLREGEQVVTRANFLVDSESLLRAALAAVRGS